MLWGESLSVPTLPGLGLIALATALSAAAAWRLRHRRGALGLPVLLVLLATPLVVVAGTVTVPNTFVNGEVADADQVNANFDAVENAVNDNDARATTAQSTADSAASAAVAAQNTASTAQSTATTASANATAASSAAAAAQGTADAATTVNTDQSAEILALQAQSAVLQTYLASFCGNGTVEAGIEACDDGNTTDDGNGCGASCQPSNVCGNGIVEPLFEACDDAGTTGGDGCSALCEVEPDWGCTGEPSACTQERFLACADGVTVADNETGLLWERKTGAPGGSFVCTSAATCPDAHNVNNAYTWSSTLQPNYPADGTAYTLFLATLNATEFAGHTDWHLPIISELQSILIGPGVTTAVQGDPGSGTNPTGQATTCPAFPCIDPGFAAVGGPTANLFGTSYYWSETSYNASASFAWYARFDVGIVAFTEGEKHKNFWVRAVRTGSCTN